jgi:hypothetical protein
MNSVEAPYLRYSAPKPVHEKPNGLWAFDHCPKGIWQEYGEFPDEQMARKEWQKLTAVWNAENGKGYVTDGKRK